MKNLIAAFVGLILGTIVNLGLITLGMALFPYPESMDFSSMESVRENMKLLGPQYFLFPLLGHALGAVLGAFIATKLAKENALRISLLIGAFYCLMGMGMILNCGGPTWYIIADLAFAYFPMSLVGYRLGRTRRDTSGVKKQSADSH